MVKEVKWDTIEKAAFKALDKKGLASIYLDRLRFEIDEVNKQGANRYWEDIINERKKFDCNKNGLLLPWLLGRLTGDADCDPIANRSDPLVLSARHSDITGLIDECGHLPFDVVQDNDKPDIDIDCLPEARDKIKEYAAERYGINNVASVGTWQTYLFKAAIGDAYFAIIGHVNDNGGEVTRRGPESLDVARSPAVAFTRELPDDINEMRDHGMGICRGKVIDQETGKERDCGHKYNGLKSDSITEMVENGVPVDDWFQSVCPVCGSGDTETPTLGSIIEEHRDLVPRDTDLSFIGFIREKYSVIDMAVRLVGRIRNAGKHAGAIIIADRDLFGNVPMQYDQKTGQWVSLWTEGRNTQLSKFGYNKWDILGLKNLAYIWDCCQMVERNHGITFKPPSGGSAMDGLLRYVDPEIDQAGVYWDADGKEVKISLNDPEALRLANEAKTDAIFQFDTDLAKRTLNEGGVRSFWDLLIFNAMGHPGPMAMIPEYVKRRDDDTQAWRTEEHPMAVEVLEDTLGVIVFQEQLTGMWQRIAGFTGPESQDARKAVAKKWKDKLKPVRQKWIDGAKKHLGEGLATEWWDNRMETFGRYAFNKCLAAGTLVRDVCGHEVAIEDAKGRILDTSQGPDLVIDVHHSGHEPVYEVRFSNGISELVTAGHRYLTDAGMVKVHKLSTAHAIKYISGGVSDGKTGKTDKIGRAGNCVSVSSGGELQGYPGELELQGNIASYDFQGGEEVWRDEGVQDENTEVQSPYLSGCLNSRGLLLAGVSDGRWICKREKGGDTTTTGIKQCGFRLSVCGVFRFAIGEGCDEEETEWCEVQSQAIRSIQSEIDRQIETIWDCAREDSQRDNAGSATHGGLCQRIPGWRWNGVHKFERLPNGWIRFEFAIFGGSEATHLRKCGWLERQQSVARQEYCELWPVDVDWLESMCSPIGLDLPEEKSGDEEEARASRVNIISIRYIGVRPVYSPEMLSGHHDYSIGPGHPIAANSHAVSYCLWAYKCLWLKAHYPEEWWACVMSRCDQKKLPRYMSASRAEGVKFGEIDINHMTISMTAHAGHRSIGGQPAVALGLISLKKVGDKLAPQFADGIDDDPNEYEDIDAFVASKGKNKILLERLIKLGSFQHVHQNIKATWMWYVHKYCTGEVKLPWDDTWEDSPFVECHGYICDPNKHSDNSRTVRGKKITEKVYSFITVAQLKQYHRDCSLAVDGWTEERVLAERERLVQEFKVNFPKRKKIPKKVIEFSPTPDESRDRIMSLYPEDYDLRKILDFESEFLGYYWHSPIDLYHTDGGASVEHAKMTGNLEAVVVEKQISHTKVKQRPFMRLVVNDGLQTTLVLIWEGEIGIQDKGLLEKDTGIRLKVEYDQDRNSFALARSSVIKPLWTKRGWNEYQDGELPDGEVA